MVRINSSEKLIIADFSEILGYTFKQTELLLQAFRHSSYVNEQADSKMKDNEECFIMGGGMIYRQFLNKADKLYITHIHKSFEADTFFPEINYNDRELIEEEKHHSEGNLDFSYTYSIYVKKN